jgi:hypothetical protein
MVEFGMGFKLSDDEKALVKHIFQPIEEALVWTNDYWSFDREYDESHVYGHRLLNAVHVLMRTKRISIIDAKLEIREMILQCEQSYVERKMQFYRDHTTISTDLKTWIEIAGFTVSGAHYWGCSCDRNHAWRENSFHIVTQNEVSGGFSTEANTPDLESSKSSLCSRSPTDMNEESLTRIYSGKSTSEYGNAFGDALDQKVPEWTNRSLPAIVQHDEKQAGDWQLDQSTQLSPETTQSDPKGMNQTYKVRHIYHGV